MTGGAGPSRAAIVAEARSWVGTPYRHQASLKGVGCDCLGLVRGVWRALIGPEPETAPAYTPDWAEAGGTETLAEAAARHMTAVDPADALPGDVLLVRWRPGLPAKHAVILIGPDRFVHAQDGASVAEGHLGPWWRARVTHGFAFPGVTGPGLEPAGEPGGAA
ncbi:NlpC/P60 family protein [Chthonobacter rhizosphaerae]|uniref:NlpC/P60 family protein n=1 Tax=Chthonobacter rhizosphaerae TaxID=2735553 RepID=UPI0015EF5CE9|nr:NlpC/P60 family protein [Chthonobacter rhizosphaerae]